MALEFAAAERLVRACLEREDISDEATLQAYRLLALVALQRDDLPEAKRAVLQLLGVSFEYAPNPIDDPPAYVALVTSVKGQLEVGLVQATPNDSTAVAAPDVAVPDIQIVRRPPPTEDTEPVVTQTPPPKKAGVSRWILIGSSVVTLGIATYFLTSGGDPSNPSAPDPLPLPPPFLD